MGSFFLDAGGAWDNEFQATAKDAFGNTVYNDLLVSTGVGIRSYVFGLPLKVDIAWRNEFNRWSRPQYLFSLGFDW